MFSCRASRVSSSMVLLALGLASVAPAAEKPTRERLNELILEAFGSRLQLDPVKAREALAAPAGQMIAADEDQDGKVDAFYFVDRDARHEKGFQPLLIKAVSPAGNFPGDRLSMSHVIFAADWRGDGFLDRVVAHFDDDGDGDIDREWVAAPWHDNFGPVHIVVVQDVGDDNRLWYHRNYWSDTGTYWWRSDFNGDEVFHFFSYDPAQKKWIQKGEGPFAFYDNDRDGFADEVVRRNGGTVRWSFDLDQDANPDHPHDYDFSFSAFGPAEVPPDMATGRTRIGTADTSGFVPWDRARTWARETKWARVMLTWNEWDNNIDMQTGEFPSETTPRGYNERWEGVLNHAAMNFQQIGGPSGGAVNRRMEVDADNSGRMRLYTTPADRQIHLRGAEAGLLRVDFDFDGKIDMEIHTADRNRDGYLDHWTVDVDANGSIDLSYGHQDDMCRDDQVPHEDLPAEFDGLAGFHRTQRRAVLDDQVALISLMREILRVSESAFTEDAAEKFYRERLDGWVRSRGLGAKMRDSLDCERFYAGIIRHRYFDRILKLTASGPIRGDLLRAYWSGDDRRVAGLLRKIHHPPATQPLPADKRLTVSNPNPIKVWQQPIVVDLKTFYPGTAIPADGLTVWRDEAQLAPRAVPSQCDDLDGDGRADELVFSLNLRPGESARLRLERAASPAFASRVRASSGDSGLRCLARTGEVRISPEGAMSFQGVVASILDDTDGEAPPPGVRAGGPVLTFVPQAKLQVLRSGPIRAVLATSDRKLSAFVYAHDAVTELRWRGDGPLSIDLAGTEGATLRTTAGVQVRELWDSGLGLAAWWPESAGAEWDAAKSRLTLRAGPAGSRLWFAGHWYPGDRMSLLPARSNWTRFVDRSAQLTGSPQRVEWAR